jgi:cell division FtsZ-interacting protein ZapD
MSANKTDLDAMYEQMGERWALVRVEKEDDLQVYYTITAHPSSFKGKVITTNLKYSEAKGLMKLLESGEEHGTG